ncbi:PREDICTED: probable cinnamyl alcohol dehydrogenase 1 [Populus euphratica]|uniref:Probable cinnamyl alcohol dehydrogenase 1 n=1 Tax=Populus euphratica TaxID=75702 RepID=A0AAJ6XIN3_POPEU|nr:PREDICTED: probable cinnamyl alcohol dehydrogenase 1 [Populus euphratica]
MSSFQEGKDCLGWEASDASGVLSPYHFKRRSISADDISVKITYCGTCYGDVIYTRNKHEDSKYPVVPSHEIAGILQEVGSNVQRFKIGDPVGVETYINSCRNCDECNEGLEVQCPNGMVPIINAVDVDGTITKGGSSFIVVIERYCYKIPENYPLALAAPLLCSGITVYTPMIHYKMNQPGKSPGVIGLGGLGHMAVDFGKAFGVDFSTSISKKEEALNVLGADKFVVSTDEEEMKALSRTLNFIIDSASGDHPFDPYMSLLQTNGLFVMVCYPKEVKLDPLSLFTGMRLITGSFTGGTKLTQEMSDFCAANKIYPEIEVMPIEYAYEAFERMLKGDVKYRL